LAKILNLSKYDILPHYKKGVLILTLFKPVFKLVDTIENNKTINQQGTN
jgi:hypothetical protein